MKKDEFIKELKKNFGDCLNVNTKTIKEFCETNQCPDNWKGIVKHHLPTYLDEFKIGRGVYAFRGKIVSKEVPMEEFIKEIPKVDVSAVPTPVINQVINLKPEAHVGYVSHGNHKDVKTIIKSKRFYPMFITGLSGNGKTLMVHEICSELKRDLIRVNITIETDEDDLLGGFRLLNGETVWQDGPVISAMENGSVCLLDEIDLASHKVMCLQPVLEGKPIYLKKVNRYVYPKEGFTLVATANTKGKGSEDGTFIGTNILNEAFLDRFPVTMYQDYPTAKVEERILTNVFQNNDKEPDVDFIQKLAKWTDVIRKTFADGGCDEVITTRRLVNIVQAYLMFKTKVKAIALCIERFDEDTKLSFLDLYTKIDAGVDPLGQTEETEEPEKPINEETDY